MVDELGFGGSYIGWRRAVKFWLTDSNRTGWTRATRALGQLSAASVEVIQFNVFRVHPRQVLDVFLDRTFSSSLISESVRPDRFITCLNAAHAALGRDEVLGILDEIFYGNWDEALQSVEIGLALTFWDHRTDHDPNVQRIVACIVARVRERDDRWTKLVKESFDIPDYCLRDSLTHGDSVLLFIVIDISRENNRARSWTSGILPSLSKFDIRNTLPKLQHDFCRLWNEIAQDARKQVPFGSPTPTLILRDIHHLYTALHDGADAQAFVTPFGPTAYPFCGVVDHRL
jgi:hypothetical protein